MALAGTPPPNRGLLYFTATIRLRGVAPVGALLHPLHHQVQQAGHGSFHVNACHCTRLKVRNTEMKDGFQPFIPVDWIDFPLFYIRVSFLDLNSYTFFPLLNNDPGLGPAQGTAVPLFKLEAQRKYTGEARVSTALYHHHVVQLGNNNVFNLHLR